MGNEQVTKLARHITNRAPGCMIKVLLPPHRTSLALRTVCPARREVLDIFSPYQLRNIDADLQVLKDLRKP
ncbi:MAG: hypothetical protein KKE57_04420 [Proteobacteria bacterium]|nr:hypothetical protein [Pseudomonadota bacterium]